MFFIPTKHLTRMVKMENFIFVKAYNFEKYQGSFSYFTHKFFLSRGNLNLFEIILF
jgi:hypothetical protein